MKINKQTKLSIVVLVIAAALLELTTAVQYFTTRHGISEQLTEKAQRDLNESQRIAKVKGEVENAIDSAVPFLKRQIMEIDIDTLTRHLRHLTMSQQQIVGIAVAFVPGFVPKHIEEQVEGSTHDGRLGIYLYEEEDEIEANANDTTGLMLHKSLLDFDYTQRTWYSKVIDGNSRTKSGMKGYWSEPYESNVRYMLLCSYSRCLHDSTGQAVAVLTADVPLRELSAMATQLYENQNRSLIGVIILHLIGLAVLGFIIHRSVRSMQRLQAVRQEKERIANELKVARDIQQSMIPKTFPGYPDRDDVEVYATLTPAREVGGDFYDFLFHDGRLFFCIGDVTGKGVPAALLMSVTRSLFRTEAVRAAKGDGPTTLSVAADVVTAMNSTIYDEQSSGYFATMFVGVLDLASGQLDYCNAGHEAPIVINDADHTHRLPVKPNLPVGALEDWSYEGQAALLKANDTLFLFTDGLSEAKDSADRQLGRKRVLELARQATDHTPRPIVALMEEAARKHADKAEQSDDITLMAVQWKGAPGNGKAITLQADADALPHMKDFVLDAADKAGLDKKEAKRLRLAMEEAVTNIIQYANTDTLTIEASTNNGQLKLSVADNGQPFDPTKAPVADTSIPADERPEGGLGILLIHRMSDGLEYHRHDGQNILTIKKNILNT